MKARLVSVALLISLLFISCTKIEDPPDLENFISFEFQGGKVEYTGDFGNPSTLGGVSFAYLGYRYTFGAIEILYFQSETDPAPLSPQWLRSLIGEEISFDRSQNNYATFFHLPDRTVSWSTLNADNSGTQYFFRIDEVIDSQERNFDGDPFVFVEGSFRCAISPFMGQEVEEVEGEFRVKMKIRN